MKQISKPHFLPVKIMHHFQQFQSFLLVINRNSWLLSRHVSSFHCPRPSQFCSSLLMMFFRSVTSGFCLPSSQLFMKPP